VTLRLDPDPTVSEWQGGLSWAFRVNLEFFETAGIGFTVNTVRYTMTYPSGLVILDSAETVGQHVVGGGRTVLQFRSPHYPSLTGRATVAFTASITDDRGNPLTVTSNASVLDRGENPVRLP
jgi:hypothetical protein